MSSFALKAVTAPGEIFADRNELAAHYASPLHLYNLKRKTQNLRLVTREEFEKRVEAARLIREEKEMGREGKGHLKDKGGGAKKTSTAAAKETSATQKTSVPAIDELNPNVDPYACLFDGTVHSSCEEALKYMEDNFNFSLPMPHLIIDLEGLLGYLHEKVKLGHMCLECEKVFPSIRGCQDHMKSERHQRVANKGWDKGEFEVFYDFDKERRENGDDGSYVVVGGDDDDVEYPDSDDDNYYDNFMRKHGYSVNSFGELELPNGKIIGHRALRRYYKRKVRTGEVSTAVHLQQKTNIAKGTLTSWERMKREGAGSGGGIGRAGAGVLQTTGSSGKLAVASLYKFRATVRKARKMETIQRKEIERKFNNANRMDKKANRLMNGVSVAHAKR